MTTLASSTERKALAVEDLVAHRAVEALDERVLLRAGLLDERLTDALKFFEVVGELLGDELAAVVRAQHARGRPWRSNSSARNRSTSPSPAPSCAQTREPRHSRVYSSTTLRIRNGQAHLSVRALTKS